MFEIRPNALYARADLIEMLTPLGIDADFFIARLRPRKVFRSVWIGADLIAALAEAPPLSDKPDAPLPKAKNGGNRTRRKATDDPLASLRQLMKRDP